MPPDTDDLRIRSFAPLSSPADLLRELPCTELISTNVANARRALHAILHGEDDRLAVVIGPCSIHDPVAAMDYAHRLQAAARIARASLEIVMRVYFEKPRTTVGWKGLINDPDLDGSFNINKGLRLARRLLCEINELGLPAGVEYLDTISPQYISDLVAWGAIGARTTESQIHREMASGLSCPVGFKNGTDGNVKIAVDAVGAASHPHHFLAVTKEGRATVAATAGNPDGHVILRGGKTPNYGAEHVAAACELLEKAGLAGAPDDRCEPREQLEAARESAGRRRRDRGAARARRAAHRRRHDREPHRGRPAGPRAGQAARCTGRASPTAASTGRARSACSSGSPMPCRRDDGRGPTRRNGNAQLMHIGPYAIEPKLILAPMAGVTDKPFRLLSKRLGAGYAVSEMTTSDPRLWRTRKSRQRLDHEGEPAPIGVQIAGADPAGARGGRAARGGARRADRRHQHGLSREEGLQRVGRFRVAAGRSAGRANLDRRRAGGRRARHAEDPHRLEQREPQRRGRSAHRGGFRHRGARRAWPHARHAVHGPGRVRDDRGDQAGRAHSRDRERRRDFGGESARSAGTHGRRCADDWPGRAGEAMDLSRDRPFPRDGKRAAPAVTA